MGPGDRHTHSSQLVQPQAGVERGNVLNAQNDGGVQRSAPQDKQPVQPLHARHGEQPCAESPSQEQRALLCSSYSKLLLAYLRRGAAMKPGQHTIQRQVTHTSLAAILLCEGCPCKQGERLS